MNLIVSAAILGGCFFGYSLLGERKRPTRGKPPKPDGTVVTTAMLLPHQGPVTLSANGVVVPLREIRLATEVAGRVVFQSENLRPGRTVAADEVLVRLDPTEYELEVRRLVTQQAQEAAELAATDVSIENTKQLLSLAKEQLKLAADERARVDSLVQRQAASMSEVDVTKRSELTAKSSLVELENRQRELVAGRELIVQKRAATEVALARAQLDLDRTVIKSPIRGRVVASMVEVESFVGAGASFVTIEDISVVEVRSNLTVDQMFRVWNSIAARPTHPISTHPIDEDVDLIADDQVPPVPATIAYRLGLRTYQWQAVLERIDGVGIDAATRTYPCLFRVDAPEQVTRPLNSASNDGPNRLMRGMFVSVMLKAESRRPLASCPEMAIRPGNRIWINRDGKLHIVPIEVVAREGDRVIIDAEGFLLDDTAAAVVISPVSNPSEGMKLLSSGKPPSKVADESRAANEKAAG
ncbi:efflux RND transporter periplasmic adaptor subunit [Rubripirellula tenax]|uniref:efflux RND transporter periplasmic adaptor subunit n=1 Tax=Rubripirellula tenax TaxID=2528015 RepID=UPI0011B70A33|nr:hemolysin D [Rubripirellula tenax]